MGTWAWNGTASGSRTWNWAGVLSDAQAWKWDGTAPNPLAQAFDLSYFTMTWTQPTRRGTQ